MDGKPKIRVGVVGCGMISTTYIPNLRRLGVFDVAACADIDHSKANARAREYKIPVACAVDELLCNPSIEFVLNLTPPAVHASVTCAALKNKKSVYSEKPIAVDREDARKILALAAVANIRIGCAPDTFLGAGLQTSRRAIDAGVIGEPLAVAAFMACPGHESWHPDPAYYYQAGGGPLFDMGPYYLTALVALLGPIRRVTASSRISFPERLIESEPRRGERIRVEVPTHVSGVLDFTSGAIASLMMSFDISASSLPCLEIYGSEGTLQLPDPNTFGGPVRIRQRRAREWTELSIVDGFWGNCRGVGCAEMAYALQANRPHRANAELAFHVLDAMQALHESSETGQHLDLHSSCSRPAALPLGSGEDMFSPEAS